ncbi:MAG: hypothetical protein UX52_C0017G0018 [Candidatus Amesbacteria bacterium GW2011_GWA1_46_35]|nr:MAG: hypothetical protein UX52_C0017G0018 [Candidatus Amesbacteria bacterium GW2011_GWA1_46_35]
MTLHQSVAFLPNLLFRLPQELALLPDHFRFAKILTLTHPDAYRQGLVLVAAAHLFNSVVLSLGIPPLPALLRRIVIR